MPRQSSEPHTPESLRAMANALAEHSSALIAMAEIVELYQLSPLEVTNALQRRQAMEYLDKFLAAVKNAVRDAREELGHFGAPVKPKMGRNTKQS
jgi:hypothetical protein